ncbi:hypothetical protein KILIM_016_00560 [Kineosphaera limosa NBRC 100340]|uniref:Uncharacterized protein n=1 Tax=Kineosphaera limosa NBRC 100340 TaxID=1184609 RepID=K6WMS9_9MICO|nr:hypothetical protein KILIM_016_00560 [Kineosphaera limosa NBRC 100340]
MLPSIGRETTRSGQWWAAWSASSRGSSFAPAMMPNKAHSASGTPCTPADVVKVTRSNSSGVSPAAATAAPPPAAIVVSHFRPGLARTVGAI